MLGIGACPWDESQVGQDIVWSVPFSLLHLFTWISFTQDKFLVEIIFVLFVSLTFHWGSCLSLGRGFLRVHISLLCISAMSIPIDFLLPSLSWSVAHPKDTWTHPPLKHADFNIPDPMALPFLSPQLFLTPFHFLNHLLFQFSLFHIPPMALLFPLMSEIQPWSF